MSFSWNLAVRTPAQVHCLFTGKSLQGKKPKWKRKLYFYYWLKRVPSITWLLMKSGNSLNSGRFVFPHIWNECWEENTSVEAEGLFLDSLLFWVSLQRNFPSGAKFIFVCHACCLFLILLVCTAVTRVSTCHTCQLVIWINPAILLPALLDIPVSSMFGGQEVSLVWICLWFQ